MDTSEVGPWAKEKLNRLGKYLNAYTTILRKQKRFQGFVYVDAFAGPGRHRLRGGQRREDETRLLFDMAAFSGEEEGQNEFIKGSPRVALDIKFPFTHYIFVEKDPQRRAGLEELKREYGQSRKIVIRQEDCND